MKVSRVRAISYIGLIAVILLQLVNLGCSVRLPNVEPFADATITLHKSVSESGDLAIAELTKYNSKLKAKYPDSPTIKAFQNSIKKIKEKWRDRRDFMGACVEYSDTLSSIVSGAKDSEKNANELVSSFNDVLKAIDLTGLSKGFSNLLQNLISRYAKYKAYKYLREAVLVNDEPIQEIAVYLKDDLKDFKELSEILRDEVIDLVDFENRAIIENREMLIEQRNALRIDLKRLWDNEYKDAKKGDVVLWWQRYCQLLKAYESLDRQINNDLLFKEYVETRSEQLKNLNLVLRLTEKSTVAVQVWAKTHKKLAKVLKEKRRPDYREMLSIASDIKSIVEEYRRKK